MICRFPEGSYQRVGLCTAEIRAKRLACSHTSARIKLDDAIKKLATSDRGNNAASLVFSSELVWLNNAIHLPDHQKGEAEKSLARILDEAHRAGAQGDKGQNMRESENEIYEMEQLHDEYVERIGELRDRIVIEIDTLLAEPPLRAECACLAVSKEAEKIRKPGAVLTNVCGWKTDEHSSTG